MTPVTRVSPERLSAPHPYLACQFYLLYCLDTRTCIGRSLFFTYGVGYVCIDGWTDGWMPVIDKSYKGVHPIVHPIHVVNVRVRHPCLQQAGGRQVIDSANTTTILSTREKKDRIKNALAIYRATAPFLLLLCNAYTCISYMRLVAGEH